MTTQMFEEFEAWIGKSDWHFQIDFSAMRPSFRTQGARMLKFTYPTHPLSVGFCANTCVTLASMYDDRAHFDGAWLWFADEPFSNWEQAAGRVAIDRIRTGYGDLRPFDHGYVYHFPKEEMELLTAFIILAVVLLWDLYVLTGRGDRIIHVSHDELFAVIAKDAETASTITAAFRDQVLGEFEL